MTSITFDVRVGGGSEPLTGGVTLSPTRVRYDATSVTMPAPQTIGLHNGKGTMTGVTPTPAGATPSWAYRAEVINGATGERKSWLVTVPDAGTVAFDDLDQPVQVTTPTVDVAKIARDLDTAATAALDSFVAATQTGGDLVLTRTNGEEVNVGRVKGDQGLPGVNAIPSDQAVAGYATTQDSATHTAIAGLIAELSPRTVYNVTEYGAKGDGTTDDTAAVQAAMDAAEANGGGKIFFPAGDYYIRSIVWLTSNVEIYGDRATIRKKYATDPYYIVFAGSSGSSKGYGAGKNNIHIHDLTFRGKFGAAGRTLCVMAATHSDDVLVERLDIAEASGAGHRFDLQGCRRVTVRDSVFQGFDSQFGMSYSEDVQADYATLAGGSFVEPDPSCYDGLPSQDITVDGCRWLPWTDKDGVTYPAGNAFGSHGTVQDTYISGLTFTNNTVNLPTSDAGTISPGAVHFLAVKNVRVEGNTFIGSTTSVSPAVGFYKATSGQSLAQVQSTGQSTTYTTPMVCSGVIVRNNDITGFHQAPTVVCAYGAATAIISDVDITGNMIHDTNATGGASDVGPRSIYLEWATRVKVSNNTVKRARYMVTVNDSTDVTISGNIATTLPSGAITCSRITRLAISANTINQVPLFPIYTTDCVTLSISANAIACNGAGAALRVNASPQFSVVGNTLTGYDAGKGIDVYGSTAGVVLGNSISGFSTPLFPAVPNSNIQVGYNTITA